MKLSQSYSGQVGIFCLVTWNRSEGAKKLWKKKVPEKYFHNFPTSEKSREGEIIEKWTCQNLQGV